MLTVLASVLTVGAFFAYSGKVRLIRALRECKQRSLTVSKKAPAVSKKASPNYIPALRGTLLPMDLWTPPHFLRWKQLFTYSWELPAYSGGFEKGLAGGGWRQTNQPPLSANPISKLLLTVELFCLQLTILGFYLQLELFSLTSLAFLPAVSWSFFAYSGKVHLISASRDCKQRSLTVSPKIPTVSKTLLPFPEVI